MGYGFIYWFLFKSLSTLISDWSSIYLLYVSWWETCFIFHCSFENHQCWNSIAVGSSKCGCLFLYIFYWSQNQSSPRRCGGKRQSNKGSQQKTNPMFTPGQDVKKTWQQWQKPWILPERELKPGLLTAAKFCQVPHKCERADEPADVFLRLVIKSSPVNYDCRYELCKTWAKESLHNGVWIRRIFISRTMEVWRKEDRTNSSNWSNVSTIISSNGTSMTHSSTSPWSR